MSLLAIFTLLVGCYEDKGNYEYKDINRITIDKLVASEGWTSTYGDTLEIIPKFTFENGNTDESHLTYLWELDGKTREGWDKRNFNWYADEVISGTLTYKVTDTKTDVVYTPSIGYRLSVNPEFDVFYGVVILAEKDGKSELSFLKLDIEIDYAANRSTVKSAEMFQNIYKLRQKEDLGTGPISILERVKESPKYTQYIILQKSGAVDVISGTLTKDINVSEAFVGGVYPPSINYLKEASYMHFADVVADQDGRLYSRIKLVSELFNTGYFSPDPLMFENEVLKNCSIFIAHYSSSKINLIHDKDNKRFLAFFDGTTTHFQNPGSQNAGKITKVPDRPISNVPADFIPLNDFGDHELINGGYYRGDYNKIGYFMLFKNSQGEYFGQDMIFYRASNSTNLTLEKAVTTKINLPGDPTFVYPTQYPNSGSTDVFIAVGNTLYRFERGNPEHGVTPHLTFDAKIASMNTESYFNRWGVLALESGKIHLLNIIGAKNASEAEKIFYSTPDDVDLGNIKHAIIRHGGNGWD